MIFARIMLSERLCRNKATSLASQQYALETHRDFLKGILSSYSALCDWGSISLSCQAVAVDDLGVFSANGLETWNSSHQAK